MAPKLIISSNNASNPLSLDLSNFMDLTDGSDMDPQDPAFSNKVISHSLLKEGGILALEDLQAKELVFPLKLNAASSSALATLITEINQVLTSPGATYSWQDDGMSQPTVFDAISGQFDVHYSYRMTSSPGHWCKGDLKLFTQPFGHTGAPRPYAAASAIGPLLMISPYNSNGSPITSASTQAGAAGFGAVGQGGVPSSAIFYPGSPSLAGDAPALLQVSYLGPLPPGATETGTVPYVAMSLLPDKNYQPLMTAFQLFGGTPSITYGSDGVFGQYLRSQGITGAVFGRLQVPSSPVPVSWAGNHRVFAVARATPVACQLQIIGNALVPQTTTATVNSGDWQLVDLGVVRYRASQTPAVGGQQQPTLTWTGGRASATDLSAVFMLPESSTWFFNPKALNASQYGWSLQVVGSIELGQGNYSNLVLADDVVGEQFIGTTGAFPGAPSAAGQTGTPMTAYSRGLVPRPDPKNGVPIIALLGMGQFNVPSIAWAPGASWANPQNLPVSAQVNVLERTRYALP